MFVTFVPALLFTLVVSNICGRLAKYIGQPKVVGEMIAGILIGPSVLGIIAPNIMKDLFNPDVKSVLYIFSNLGLGLYMFLVGVSIDHQKINPKLFRDCTILSISGILIPFVSYV